MGKGSVDIHYRQVGGVSEIKSGKRDGLLLRCNSTDMIHSLVQESIFRIPKDVKVYQDWEDFIKADDPPAEIHNDRQMILVEYDDFWPVSDEPGPLTPAIIASRQVEVIGMYEGAYQRNAVAKATKEDTEHFLTNAGVVVTMLIAAGVTLIFGIAVFDKVIG